MRVRWELGNFSRHPASFPSLECNTNLNSSYPQCGRVDNFKPRDPVLSFSHWHARLPGLFWDLGHEPGWDDKLQNIVMMNWKRRQECRGPEGCRWEAVASSTGIWRRRCRKRLRLKRRRKRNRKKKRGGRKEKEIQQLNLLLWDSVHIPCFQTQHSSGKKTGDSKSFRDSSCLSSPGYYHPESFIEYLVHAKLY